MNKIPESIQRKINALYELSNRGVGGEAKNADKFLNQLLAQHDLTLNDLLKKEQKTFSIQYRNKEDFHYSLIALVLIKLNIDYSEMFSNQYHITCTNEEYIFIDSYINLLNISYLEHLNSFNQAFVFKNNLGIKSDEYENKKEPLNIDEILSFMANIKKTEINKQIEK